MKGDTMQKKIVSSTLETLPPLAAAQHENLDPLSALSDNQINTSDIPEMTDEEFRAAVKSRFHKPRKQQITAMVDADVLEWLKSKGRGYQSRLNTILRDAMLRAIG
jgi:uncharacterized protein (DUF4415 family)